MARMRMMYGKSNVGLNDTMSIVLSFLFILLMFQEEFKFCQGVEDALLPHLCCIYVVNYSRCSPKYLTFGQ